MGLEENNNNIVRFNESFTVIEEKDSPIRQLGKAEEPIVFSIQQEKEINTDEIFQLKVHTKGVGTILFAFNLKKLNRERLIDQLFLLKKKKVTDKETARIKISKMVDIVLEHRPLFAVYSKPEEFGFNQEEAKTIFEGIVLFYLTDLPDEPVSKKEKTQETIETEPEKPAEKATKEEKTITETGFVGYLKRSGRIIAKDKFNFIFALVAAFLVGFTLGVGIYNAYLGKIICIFFFVSTLVGMALNSFVYRDVLVEHKFKSLHVLLDLITSFIGIVLSIGGYFIFISITKEKATPAPHILLIIAVQLLSMCASIGFSFILKKFDKKKKKKQK